MFEKHLQKTMEREDARNNEWFQRQKKTKTETFFYEFNPNMCKNSNSIMSMISELEYQKNLKQPSMSRIKKLTKKLADQKAQNPELFLTLNF
jgi:hypothetical protein